MERKLFSIITPCYNAEPKIEKTVRSVLSQDRDLFEYVVVDGGSTDGTPGLVEDCAEGAAKIISEPDEGVYEAMNKGVEASAGKYLYFLGAGDSLKPGVLTKVANRLPAHDLALVYGNVYMVDKGLIYVGEFDRAKMKKRNICHQAAFYGRAIFDAVGMYDLRFKVLADYALNLKCFWNDRVEKKYLGYVIANYEGGGISHVRRDYEFSGEYAELMNSEYPSWDDLSK